MKNKKLTIVIVILIIAIIGITIVELTITGNNIESKSEVMKIGVIGTLTGVGSFHGQQEIRGVEIALDEINSNGGINGKKIKLIIEDSPGNPEKAVSAFKKLTEINKVDFIIGDSWSSTTVVIVPIANEKKILLISHDGNIKELFNKSLNIIKNSLFSELVWDEI